MNPTSKYRWREKPTPAPLPRPDKSPQDPEPYIADPELVDAVNLAFFLGRPLLLEGEAGCGKTRLAAAVAHELRLPLFRWDVRSSSRATEGLYQYDALGRLHDVHLEQHLPRSASKNPRYPDGYVTYGPLGDAFDMQDRPAVLLIDEIDKADLDFPNDLLAVLEKPWRFKIPETGKVVEARENLPPLVIITSNQEKGELPRPFLRRCIYYYIPFPESEQQLKQIVEAHRKARPQEPIAEETIAPASTAFLEVRSRGGLLKPPGTSEFLDWLRALSAFRLPAPALAPGAPLPYPWVLLKTQADLELCAGQDTD